MKDPAVREKWAKRVERWNDSGLSAKEFANEIGVNSHSLSWWRWHLAHGAAPSKPRVRRRHRSKVPPVAPLTFVEVPSPPTMDGIEIILPTLRVCVRPGFDDATLGRLLDVLGRRP